MSYRHLIATILCANLTLLTACTSFKEQPPEEPVEQDKPVAAQEETQTELKSPVRLQDIF